MRKKGRSTGLRVVAVAEVITTQKGGVSVVRGGGVNGGGASRGDKVKKCSEKKNYLNGPLTTGPTGSLRVEDPRGGE